ncbi:hypothetical protein ABPG72_000149 [Tetrahymena utriculariae]
MQKNIIIAKKSFKDLINPKAFPRLYLGTILVKQGVQTDILKIKAIPKTINPISGDINPSKIVPINQFSIDNIIHSQSLFILSSKQPSKGVNSPSSYEIELTYVESVVLQFHNEDIIAGPQTSITVITIMLKKLIGAKIQYKIFRFFIQCKQLS